MLNEREERVLEAVIRSYIDTAEPAGSRTVVRRYRMNVSPATVRNTMADLEEKGFLFHPHTSAGRIPTDLAYRYYVDTLMRPLRLSAQEVRKLRLELLEDNSGAIDRVVRRAAQVLGLLTGELGVGLAPRLDDTVLEKLELIALSSERILLVLTLGGGTVRTVYVDVPGAVPSEALAAVAVVLNERLSGRTLTEIRATLPDRLRDITPPDEVGAEELLNIVVQSAEEALDGSHPGPDAVHLGRTSVLATQPEFASGSRLLSLIELTERPELLASVIGGRESGPALKVTIGAEHAHPELNSFTIVTSQYQVGNLSGVVGVMGPTRMPYERVVTIVKAASALLSEVLAAGREAAADES